jgi:phenylalanyl-tRNA synthetase beta chain
VREETRVCIGLMGPVGRGALDWRRPAGEEELLLRLKGIVAGVARGSGDAELEASPASEPYHEAGQSVRLSRAGRELGCAGLLRADLRREWRMLGPVAVGEFSLAALAGDDAGAGTVRVPPAFPAVERDVALVVEEGVTHARVLGVIRGSAPAELTRVRLFDIFRGGNVGQGRKSLAYSLEFRSAERSLTDEEANRHHEAIKAALRAELNAEIRES